MPRRRRRSRWRRSALQIDHCFGADSVPEIVRRLEAIEEPWAAKTLADTADGVAVGFVLDA